MFRKHDLIRGTFILTFAGLLCRAAGFLFRIFLSRAFSEEGVGLYQLIFPVLSVCFSFCASGIQAAVSRSVGRSLSSPEKGDSGRILLCGLVFSVLVSLVCFCFLRHNAADISRGFLGDIRCEPLLVLVSFALPFGAVHACICGYCYGLQSAGIPAFSQLIEELSKIIFVFFLYYILKPRCPAVPIDVAAAGLAAGELCACACALYCVIKKYDPFFSLKSKPRAYARCIKELLEIGVPVSCSRILITFMQCVEAVSIPLRLRMYGMGAAASLRIYGVLTGMALPCIFLPSVISNSVSSLLMPAVAEIQAASDKAGLKEVIRKVSFSCLKLGLFCCLFFLAAGNFLGRAVFHSDTAGKFIVSLAWICPFFYINTAMASILNGLAKASAVFFINAAGLVLRILDVFYVIPALGITGYFWGLLSSQLVVSVLLSSCISRIINKENT